MEHIAIMKKSWGLTDKILSGQKKIESRWYFVKYRPWDVIKEGETVYFKDSGGPVRIKAEVSKVMQFVDLTPKRVKEILDEYGKDDGIEKEKIPEFFERFKNKKYCMLIFLKNPIKIKPFEIDKTEFGAMSAWITIDDISKIKKKAARTASEY
ncbi:MAG: ASCH domain-containing protein [Candidatus Azambacteria bacterium]|nr:ASCH domain-containing protein [Candidatus Azambacteria bacterium]